MYAGVSLAYNARHRLRDNEAAFDRYKIKPRILVNVENIDTSSELFGIKVSFLRRLSHQPAN